MIRKRSNEDSNDELALEWLIAGEKVKIVKPTARKLRRLNAEQIRILAYKQRLIDLCREGDLLKTLAVFEEIQKLELQVDLVLIQMVLSACSGVSWRDCGDAGKPLFNGTPCKYLHIAAETAMDIYHKYVRRRTGLSSEALYTCVIRALCRDGRIDEAVKILSDLCNSEFPPRLRSFSPPLISYAQVARIEDCFSIWKDAQSHGLELSETEYIWLIRACTSCKDKERYEIVMLNFCEDVLKPQYDEGWNALRDWFESDDEACHWIMNETTVSAQGSCCCCHHQLESIDLTESKQKRFKDQVKGLVSTHDRQQRQWKKFLAWLEPRASNFQVVVDGANVGYFVPSGSRPKPNGGLADLFQIDLIVQHYKRCGKRTLVMLHSRHVNKRSISPQSLKIFHSWQEEDLLYTCERGNNDDWYWLWAAASIGGKAIVVTNDEMRDHHFQMLSHRSFLRWKERHCARFSFGPQTSKGQTTNVFEPKPFSERIQRSNNGQGWHIPCAESDRWLCVKQEVSS